MEAKAREAGEDEDQVDLVKLAALGNSRFKRLTNRQQDRLTQKETAEAAERAATQAAQAAQAAQATAQVATAGVLLLPMHTVGPRIAHLYFWYVEIASLCD